MSLWGSGGGGCGLSSIVYGGTSAFFHIMIPAQKSLNEDTSAKNMESDAGYGFLARVLSMVATSRHWQCREVL